jgi:nitroreductase
VSPGVHEIFKARWSPRSFSSREVLPEDLKTVLDAARWAASSYNEQPWRFVVATKADKEAYDKFLTALIPFNQGWAKSAPVLILTVAKTKFSHNGEANYHALHDAGAALAQLMLQATALGLHTHGMAGYDHAKMRTVLGIPEDYALGTAVALGYLDTPEKLPEGGMRDQEIAPRQRKPLAELAYGPHWGQPLNGL